VLRARFIVNGAFLIGLGLGSITSLSGCGRGGGSEETVPPRGEPTAEERKQREEAVKKAMEAQRRGR